MSLYYVEYANISRLIQREGSAPLTAAGAGFTVVSQDINDRTAMVWDKATAQLVLKAAPTLATEITNDPKALGFAALVTAQNADAIANKLNSTYAGVGIVWRPAVTSSELLGCLVWTEVSAFTAAQWGAVNAMLNPASVDATNVRIRNFFAGLFSGATLTNMTAIAKVTTPTRAEEVVGAGYVVSSDAVKAAMGWL